MSNILKPVLSAILIDMINAQNQANIRSAQIAELYVGNDAKEPLLQFFDVPSANIKSFDFELKFGLETTDSLIGSNVGKELSELIDSEVNGFILTFSQLHKLSTKQNDDVKQLISSLWNEEAKSSNIPSHLAENQQLISEVKLFIKELKQSIQNITGSAPLIDKKSETLGLKAVLDVNELNPYKGDILCSINVNAEIAGMKAGFKDETTHEEGKPQTHRKIYLAGT